MLELNEIHQGDCLELMRRLPDNSVDLICTDPPYFKCKKTSGSEASAFNWWDSQWDKPDEFLKWIDRLAKEWQRVLKANGSLYCFASANMSSRVETCLTDRFSVVNNIRWMKEAGWHNKIRKEDLRGWLSPWESIIFCEHYGADNAAKGEAGYEQKCDELRGFIFEPIRAYLDGERAKAGFSIRQVAENFQRKSGSRTVTGMAGHWFTSVQWTLPTQENYKWLQNLFGEDYLRTQYEELRTQYEELRTQYEELRRPFTVTADVPYTDVWTFPTVQSYPGKHVCEKPAPLLEHVINASSRPGAVVLDCFAGSGSTLVAAKKLGRQYIGMEIDPHWVAQCKQRLGDFAAPSVSIEDRVAWLETQVKATAAKVRKLERNAGQLSLFDIAG